MQVYISLPHAIRTYTSTPIQPHSQNGCKGLYRYKNGEGSNPILKSLSGSNPRSDLPVWEWGEGRERGGYLFSCLRNSHKFATRYSLVAAYLFSFLNVVICSLIGSAYEHDLQLASPMPGVKRPRCVSSRLPASSRRATGALDFTGMLHIVVAIQLIIKRPQIR